ncbi:choice-of-anchor D domain-containing protein [Nostoc sp. CHAB 5834]|nr:choice-of-anchor D domain-containing protein [Nostoc sp. CHAB 5834]
MPSRLSTKFLLIASLLSGGAPAFSKSYEYNLSVKGLQVSQQGDISVSTNVLDFPGKLVGVSSQKSFTVTNNSLRAVSWKQLPTLSGSSGFTLAGTTCGSKMAPQQSCTVTVQFTPTQESAAEGLLSFSINGSKKVSLVGSGDGSKPLELSQDFTTLSPRQGSYASGAVTLTNSNSIALKLGTLLFTSVKGSVYTGLDAQNCNGKTLQPGESCSITATLSGNYAGAPLPEGPTSATLSIPVAGKNQEHVISGSIIARPYLVLGGGSAIGNSPTVFCYNSYYATYGGSLSQYACLNGAGVSYNEPRAYCSQCMRYLDGVTLSTLSLPFGTLTIGESKSLQVLVTNESENKVDLALEPISVTPANAGVLTQSTSCAELPSGESCVIQLDVSPTRVANFSGKITLASNAEGSPYFINFNARSEYKNANVGELNVSSVTYGAAPFALNAPASDSPGAWSFSSGNPGVASIAGNVITVKAGGSSTITATQAASGAYGPATKTAVLTVLPADSAVQAWPSISGKVGESLALTPPQSNSTGVWAYTSSDPQGAQVTGANVLPKKVGIYVITATQAATSSFKTASVTANITVDQGTPVIGAWSPISVSTTAPSFTLNYPTSTSNGVWSAISANTSVATIANGVVTVKGAGTTTLTATQASTADYLSGTATMTMTVTEPVIGVTKIMWQFNGAPGATATAANLLNDAGIASSAVSGVSYVSGGLEGTYARFNNGSINLYDPAIQLANKPFTFEWWQRGASRLPSFTFGNPGTYSALASNADGIYTSHNGNWNYSFSGITVNPTGWQHVAVVRDSTKLAVYINGVLAASTLMPASVTLLTSPGNRLAFGTYLANTTMDLDQVRLTVGEARYLTSFTPSTALTAN